MEEETGPFREKTETGETETAKTQWVKKMVKETRHYTDEKGYMVSEEVKVEEWVEEPVAKKQPSALRTKALADGARKGKASKAGEGKNMSLE